MSWEIIVGLVLVIGTILGVTIPLHQTIREDMRFAQSRSDAQIAAISQNILAIHQEMKDFHSRLCRIEERSRGLKMDETKEK
jgi:hypothetical protein